MDSVPTLMEVFVNPQPHSCVFNSDRQPILLYKRSVNIRAARGHRFLPQCFPKCAPWDPKVPWDKRVLSPSRFGTGCIGSFLFLPLCRILILNLLLKAL